MIYLLWNWMNKLSHYEWNHPRYIKCRNGSSSVYGNFEFDSIIIIYICQWLALVFSYVIHFFFSFQSACSPFTQPILNSNAFSIFDTFLFFPSRELKFDFEFSPISCRHWGDGFIFRYLRFSMEQTIEWKSFFNSKTLNWSLLNNNSLRTWPRTIRVAIIIITVAIEF